MYKYILIGLVVLFIFRRFRRKKGVDEMMTRPYRYEMDSKRSTNGWRGGF